LVHEQLLIVVTGFSWWNWWADTSCSTGEHSRCASRRSRAASYCSAIRVGHCAEDRRADARHGRSGMQDERRQLPRHRSHVAAVALAAQRADHLVRCTRREWRVVPHTITTHRDSSLNSTGGYRLQTRTYAPTQDNSSVVLLVSDTGAMRGVVLIALLTEKLSH
jgi:hypothetical protein